MEVEKTARTKGGTNEKQIIACPHCDGSILNEEQSYELVEGFLENGNYYKTIRFSNIAEVEKASGILLGEYN